MWLTHFWHSWSQFFIFAWDVTAGGILRTGVLICLVLVGCCCNDTKFHPNDWLNIVLKYISICFRCSNDLILMVWSPLLNLSLLISFASTFSNIPRMTNILWVVLSNLSTGLWKWSPCVHRKHFRQCTHSNYVCKPELVHLNKTLSICTP